MKRNLLLVGIVSLVTAAGGVGWFAGSQTRSPADIAAATKPPPASNITVEVLRRVLSADLVTRGDFLYEEPVAVSLSGSFAAHPEKLVATEAPILGAEVSEGDLLIEVVGRPVFVLTGEIPMYRDLRPGAEGEDILQLEEALTRLGFLEGAADGVWDEGTGTALSAFYAAAGYRANGLSSEDEASLSLARSRVRAAEAALSDANAANAEARAGPPRSALLAAEAEVEASEDALSLAQLDADWANQDAAAAVAQAESALDAAKLELQEAQATDPAPTADELAVLEKAVKDAETAVTETQRDAERVAAERASLIEQTESRYEVSLAFLAELREGPNTAGFASAVDAARRELTSAREDLAELAAGLGTWLPAGELVFLPRLPVRVDSVAVARGSEITGPFVTLSGSEVVVQAAVPEDSASLVKVGMTVAIRNEQTDGSIVGRIELVAERSGTHGVSPDRVYIEIIPEEAPPELIGRNVRITIPVSSTDGPVLAVPAAALFATADGSTIVEVEDQNGTLYPVRVETGLAAGGLVEITPLGGRLSEGDLVVVGRADIGTIVDLHGVDDQGRADDDP